ncbi:MAG: molecular chaperone HtpG, partial [Bacteroidales bacterium]
CAFSEQEQNELKEVFSAQLPRGNGMYMVSFDALGQEVEPLIITRSEFMRRMKEMAELNPEMNFYGQMGDQYNLVVNTENPIVLDLLAKEKKSLCEKLAPLYEKIETIKGKKADIEALSKDLKPEEVPSSDKERIADLDKEIEGVSAEKVNILKEYGAGESIVGQLIDLALLSNGLLKGEALHKFLKRSVELIRK